MELMRRVPSGRRDTTDPFHSGKGATGLQFKDLDGFARAMANHV